MANNKKRISRSRRKVSRRKVSRRRVSRRRVSRRRVSRRRVSRRRVSRRRVSRRRVSRRRVSRRRVSRRRVSRKKGNLKYNFFFKDTRAKIGAHLSKAMSHNPFSNPFRNKSPSPVLRLHPEDQARFKPHVLGNLYGLARPTDKEIAKAKYNRIATMCWKSTDEKVCEQNSNCRWIGIGCDANKDHLQNLVLSYRPP